MPDLLDPLADAGDAEAILGDGAWLYAMLAFELFLIDSLASAELVPGWVAGVVDAVVGGETFDVGAIAAQGRSGGNPVIPLVAALSAAADGYAANEYDEADKPSNYIHLGATSQDVVDTGAMIVARQVIEEVSRSLGSLIGRLADLAERHRRTPMAGRTLGQHASPTTFGLVVAGWLDGVLAARDTLRGVRERLPFQYGGSVGSRAILGERIATCRPDDDPAEVVATVMANFATFVGLRDAVPWQSNRIPIVELGAALAAVVGSIGAIAADINVLSRTEIAEVSERLGAGEGGSSAMPHKRNPVTSVLLVSVARRSPGLVATLFDAQVTEDQRSTGAWHSEWTTLRELERLTIQASATAADLADRLEVDVARMRANLETTAGLVYSERVTAILAASMGKSAAFELVAEASRETVATARPLQVVLAGRLAGGSDEKLTSRVLAAFDPDYGMDAPGGIIDSVLARVGEQS